MWPCARAPAARPGGSCGAAWALEGFTSAAASGVTTTIPERALWRRQADSPSDSYPASRALSPAHASVTGTTARPWDAAGERKPLVGCERTYG